MVFKKDREPVEKSKSRTDLDKEEVPKEEKNIAEEKFLGEDQPPKSPSTNDHKRQVPATKNAGYQRPKTLGTNDQKRQGSAIISLEYLYNLSRICLESL